MTNESFPAAPPDEPVPPEDADLDARSQPVYDEPETDDPALDTPDPAAEPGGPSAEPG